MKHSTRSQLWNRRRGERGVAMFPTRLTDSRGFDIAQALLEGFKFPFRN